MATVISFLEYKKKKFQEMLDGQFKGSKNQTLNFQDLLSQLIQNLDQFITQVEKNKKDDLNNKDS